MIKIPKKLIERLMKEYGAKRISNEAKELIEKIINEKIQELTSLSTKNAHHFGRKLIKKEDIEFALKAI